MEIIKIEKNDYDRNFITIKVDGNESFKGSAYKRGDDYRLYTCDKSGRTHEICVRRYVVRNFTGKIIRDFGTYNVGCGNGTNMGWVLDLSKRDAFRIARARMLAIQTFELVARVHVQQNS
jgi:hypothetical protein